MLGKRNKIKKTCKYKPCSRSHEITEEVGYLDRKVRSKISAIPYEGKVRESFGDLRKNLGGEGEGLLIECLE